jgi:hypothetical protein
LVVIAIIAILAALLLPVLSRAKMAADSAGCKSNLRQLMLGPTMYVEEYKAYPEPDGELGTAGFNGPFWQSKAEQMQTEQWMLAVLTALTVQMQHLKQTQRLD